MAVSILDVCIGKYYSFSAPDAVMFSDVSGLVIDKTQNELTLKTDAGELQTMTIQPWIVAEEVQTRNSQEIESQLAIIRQRFQEIAQHEIVVYTNENEAVDGIEEKREFEATGYYLHNGFPHKVFNTIPYVLNRDEDNPVAFQLLLYALDYCISFPELYPNAYMPYFPNQFELFSEENIAVLRRVARVIRSALVRANYQEGTDLRFTGVITTFTGDHGWINVNDKLSLRFSKDSILDNRLIEILKLGMPVVGWTEVTFTICRTQSGYYACRVRPTELAISVAKQLGCDISVESSLPDNFEDSPICGRNSLPQSLQDALLYIENKDMFTPRKTMCGEVIACIEDTDDRSKYVGQILANGNIYNFHYYQVCDESVATAWREKQLVGKKVVFEPAFNFTKNFVSLSADYVRYYSFTTEIPKADCEDLAWGVCVYDRNELESFVQLNNVNREFVPLQPWLPIYDEFLGNGTVGRINPHSTRQRGWIHLTNGFRYGFFYSQIQDRLLYVLLNSALRESIDWSKVDIWFTPKKANGIGVADNVILTMKSRLELSKRFGLEGPVMPLSEKMVFTRRTAFVPIDANTAKLPDLESSEEIIAEITDYNPAQKRIKLTQKPSTAMEAYNLRFEWIEDSVLIEVLNSNRWRDISVSYKKRISMDGKYYPYDLKLTTLCREKLEAQLNSKAVEPIKKAEPISEQRTVQIPQPQIKRELGILLPTKREATGGYIGKEYYTKACGMQQFPSGVASYDKRLLSFKPEFQYAYVVSYTYNAQQAGTVKYALSVDYYAKYEYSSLGKIIIRADGIVEVTSLLAVTADKYLRRDVSIILKTGDSVDGVVESFDKNSFSIMTSDEANALINFDTIEKVYIFGEIRPYFAVNGTGRIDQYFFFHINNMALSAEAAQITDGVQVKYTLRGVKRDNGLEAADIQIAPDDYLDVFVVGKSDTGEYRVVNVSDYGVKYCAEEQSLQIKNAPGMLNHEYCDYKVRLRKKRTETKWNWTTDGITRPKLWYGYLTSLENQIAVVKNEMQHKTNQAGVEFKCTELVRYLENNGVNGVVDTNRYDYTIMYTLAKQLDGSMLIHITKVYGRELKRRFGVLHMYTSNGSYGFIVADEDADIPNEVRRQQNIDYYCTLETMQNPPSSISTRYNRYYVAFVGETMFSGRRKATKVEFIKISPLAMRTQPNATESKNLRRNQDIEEEYETETSIVKLNEILPSDPSGCKMLYGILRAYSPKFTEVRIFDNYIPANSLEDGQVKPPIAIAGPGLVFNCEEIKTSKFVYLIRFAIKDDSQKMPYSLDENVEIEVLQAFLRGSTKLLEINGGCLKIEKRVPKKERKNDSNVMQVDGNEIIDYQSGEILYIENKTGSNSYIAEYVKTNFDGTIFTSRGGVDARTQRVYRFGIITDFDEGFTHGIMNHCCRVDLSTMENKAYNMLRTLKRQMVVMYVYERGQIISIVRCDNGVMNLVPWDEGRVHRYVEDQENKARYIDIDVGGKMATHYLSTMSDGYVCKRIKQNLIEDDHVYAKLISLPIKRNNGVEMVSIALDVHCLAEEDTLIEYDQANNRYLAVRNPTYKIELEGSETLLREYVGKKVEVVFTRDEKRLAAHIAAIGINDDETELLIGALPQTVFETSLARMLERRIDIGTYPVGLTPAIFRSIRSSGLKTSEQNWHLALLAKKVHGVDERFRYEGKLRRTSSTYMLMGITSRLTEIFEDNEQEPDEYFYYANTLAQVSHTESKYALNLYRVFQVDYCTLGEIRNFETSMSSDRAFRESDFQNRLVTLFKKEPLRGSLVAHLLQLDDLKREYLVQQIVPKCHQLAGQLGVWCQRNGISTEARDVDSLLRIIKEKYRRTKSSVLSDLLALDWVVAIQRGEINDFMMYMCETDRARFAKFVEECKVVSAVVNKAPREEFFASEASLKEAYKEVTALKVSIETHPSLEAVELLYNTGRLDELLDMIQSRLNKLYTDERNIPRIQVEVNEYSIDYNTTMLLVVSNESGSQQTAKDVTLSLLKYTDDDRIDITSTPVIQGTSQMTCTLRPGEKVVYEANISIDYDYPKGEKVYIGWSVDYKRDGSFENGVTNTITSNVDGEINLQLQQEDEKIDKTRAVNEYANKDKVALMDSKMFFGREDEKKEIIEFILEEDCFVSGRIVIVYGQKKCGKTSLIHQIMNELRARGNGQQKALLMYIGEFQGEIGTIEPERFYPVLYTKILQLIEGAACEDEELGELLMEDELQVPDMISYVESDRPAVFNRYIMRFLRTVKDRYQIVLVMDEFTGWCAEIERNYRNRPEVLNSLLFVKILSDLGFVQIIIGHANMEHALTSLGAYNKIGQFARKINLSALKKEDAEDMIRVPMVRQFGFCNGSFGPYSTPLGKIALDRILDMSGRSPFVLMRLCDSIFRWYKDSPYAQITDKDIREIVNRELSDGTKWSLAEFNFLLEESGDEQSSDEQRPSYKYLKEVALHYDSSTNNCDANVCSKEIGFDEAGRVKSGAVGTLMDEERANEEVRDMLVARHVISHENNRIKIHVGLFREYILRRYGHNI